MATQPETQISASNEKSDDTETPAARNFLDLLPELRLQIYGYVLQNENFNYITRPALLQSCGLLLNEASDLYCKKLADEISKSEQSRRVLRGQQTYVRFGSRVGHLLNRSFAEERRTNNLMDLAKSEAKALGYCLSWQVSGQLVMNKLKAHVARK
ncbi:hypothetical protein CLAFUW4_14171 [Fulvia fulva]|uniref:Uncharacterized protein n=1 Tax=Passalora fulva TaxID=5499 RepID=A0A9Q8UVZ3_PASFU|nr:uncharacterized protein CLAFUR5_14004 [Fulvia fulva]KAK4610727.1 hypothetical protein CLAFUR4_14174 [Fulvia fulva]KAK4611315.1 hypothetical protein CLAFUR0_14178 [Fulvia fulva]UJO24504.1 hypothetical protein CLAFUR5_14004 [Fulvia fulva]WPV21909.1 hypothetical protein CLAFUW4_14171 [Fulvia fulva]WPV36662.1 hypothetical protein CLAFUW7_14182 [Fulvia fulva]